MSSFVVISKEYGYDGISCGCEVLNCFDNLHDAVLFIAFRNAKDNIRYGKTIDYNNEQFSVLKFPANNDPTKDASVEYINYIKELEDVVKEKIYLDHVEKLKDDFDQLQKSATEKKLEIENHKSMLINLNKHLINLENARMDDILDSILQYIRVSNTLFNDQFALTKIREVAILTKNLEIRTWLSDNGM